MKAIFALLLLVGSFAKAEVNPRALLDDQTVKAIFKLMNDKHDGQCQQTPDNLKDAAQSFRCFGGMMPVDKPTPRNTGCMFEVAIKCPGETAFIRGGQSIWSVQMPAPPLVVGNSVQDRNTIWDISFTTTP